jgi:hypothetical protein
LLPYLLGWLAGYFRYQEDDVPSTIRRPPFELMNDLDYTTIIEFAEPLARRRGSALDR